jgi:hypothetical protein
MPLLKFVADAGKRVFGLFRAAEFSCADCDYWNSCAAATDDCVLRAGQANKWKKSRVSALTVDAAAFIQHVH